MARDEVAGEAMSDHFSLPAALGRLRDCGWTPGGIVDIGVATGTAGLYTVWPDTPLCLIEPSREAMVYMRQIAERYANVHIFNCAASDRNGELVGRQPVEVPTVYFGRAKGFPEHTFPARTCDDMVAEAGLDAPILLKIDTDSHVREVLAGAVETLERTEVCVIETNVFHPLRGMITPTEIWAFLADRGFAFFDFADCSIAASGLLRAVDIVFVRPDAQVFRTAYERSGKSAEKFAKRARQYREYAARNPLVS
jgi:FkbM family methyltransferase